MSEFGKLAGDAKKFAQDHPEQVEKGEQAVEDKLGLGHDDAPQQAGGAQAADELGSGQQDEGGPQSTATDQDQEDAHPGQ